MALEANMGISVEDIQKFTDQSIPESNTYFLDWKNGRISGNVGDIDALHQHIYKTLKTEVNRYLIYDLTVGSGIGALVKAQKTSREYLETEIPRLVKKALTDKRILSIHDFSFEYPECDEVKITFYCDTIYGRTSEEVIF